MIIMNKLMQEEFLKIQDVDNTFDFTGKLSVMNPTVYRIQDGIFMKVDERDKITEKTVDYLDYDELSDFEWSYSEFFIGSYFDGITYEQSLRLAFDIVELWGYKLHALFPEEEFHIIINVSNIVDSDEKTVRISYYTYRGEDSFHYELDSLDDFLGNAILVNVVEADEEYYEDDDEDDVDSDAIEADGET